MGPPNRTVAVVLQGQYATGVVEVMVGHQNARELQIALLEGGLNGRGIARIYDNAAGAVVHKPDVIV
jgi:hypothetical protein